MEIDVECFAVGYDARANIAVRKEHALGLHVPFRPGNEAGRSRLELRRPSVV